jgi:predicted DNA-binding transcriptional regulator AlpA
MSNSKQALRPAQGAKKLGISVPTLYRYARDNPNFPKLHKLSERVTILFEDELDAFMAGKSPTTQEQGVQS